MANLSVQSNQPLLPVNTPKAAPAAKAESTAKAPEQAAMSKDSVEWKSVPASDRVKTAIATTFKKTIIPYTVGGALVAPAAGAVIGGFVGAFSGQAGKFALEGAKFGSRYSLHGAAAGAVISGVDAAVTGTVVGTSPDKQSAMVRMGSITLITGLLTAEDGWDVLGAGVGGAAESVRAARIFDATNEALQKK
jgi:hypothetical protein